VSRARNIKPSFFTNDILAECDMGARLLFAGLWTIADREGRLEDRPKKIKAEILPYDDCDADSYLQQLEQHGFITRYEVNGTRYIQVLNFVKHQSPHVKESASTIPAPDKHQTSPVQNVPLPPSPIPLPDSPIPHPSTRSPVKKPAAAIFAPPDWIDAQKWEGLMEVRVEKKAAQTEKALKSLVSRLDQFRMNGHDPNEIIENSIRNSWKDVFEPKGNNNANTGRIQQQGAGKPSWKSEGQRLADKYREDAEREEQAAISGAAEPNLCIAEGLR
jgi:hypothetical protein